MPDARKFDHWTSHAAANDMKNKSAKGRWLVLTSLARRPMNDFELAAENHWQQTSIGKRRLECQRHGLVAPHLDNVGEQVARPAPSGSKSLVWELTAKGRHLLLEVESLVQHKEAA